MTIKYIGYELNTATASDTQVDLASNPDTVTHTSNRIFDQTLLSFRTIGEVSVLSLPTNRSIDANELAPQIMLNTAVQ